MKITTAWFWQDTDDAPELIAAYDELTGDAWNGHPEFFTTAVEKAKADGAEVRHCTIEVPSDAVYALFDEPTIAGAAAASPSQETRP